MAKKLSALTVLICLGALLVASVDADETCSRPGNLTYNCNFDRFVDRSTGGSTRIVPDGWLPWVVMGNPAFDIDDHGSAPGAPAQRIWSDGGTWTAGLYQQVQVTPGRWYVARIDWAPPDSADVERRMGIDPKGGTDPLSPDVIWGPSTWEMVRMPDLHAVAFAHSPTVTVFVWTHHPVSHGADQVFLDAVTLVEDPALSPPTSTARPPTLTPTRRPPTQTPTPVQPTDTAIPTSTDTPVPTATSTPLPTETLTPTATPTSTPTSTEVPVTDTPLPTWTPSRTPVPVAQVVHTETAGPSLSKERGSSHKEGLASVLPYVAAAALGGALLLGGAVVGMVMRRQKDTGNHE